MQEFSLQRTLAALVQKVCPITVEKEAMMFDTASGSKNQSLIGTWHVTMTFQTGPRAGQSETLDQFFQADGTLTSIVTSGPSAGLQGRGSWQQAGNSHFTCDFTEQIMRDGQIVRTICAANQFYLAHNGKTFKGDGHASLIAPDGTVQAKSTSTVTAERTNSTVPSS
jgi:hypothetical protein